MMQVIIALVQCAIGGYMFSTGYADLGASVAKIAYIIMPGFLINCIYTAFKKEQDG